MGRDAERKIKDWTLAVISELLEVIGGRRKRNKYFYFSLVMIWRYLYEVMSAGPSTLPYYE